MRWNSWLNRRRWERQMDAEFQFHLESQINDYVEQGLSREDAESRARREFGGLDLAKEECREQRPFEWLDHLLRDFRYASRSLRKSPGFTAAAILTLALAIGANTAIFSALEGVVLKPLPYRDPDRLVLVALYNRALKYPTSLSYPDFLDWQRSSRSFEQIAAFREQGFDLTSPGAPERVDGKEISSNFFRTFGVDLALGRELSLEEDRIAGPPAVVISNRLWRDRFAGSPTALGKTITLNGAGYTIVGVLRPGFHFNQQQADVYTALGRGNPLFLTDRAVHDTLCVARLHTEVSIDQARAEMNTVQEHVAQLNPDTARGQPRTDRSAHGHGKRAAFTHRRCFGAGPCKMGPQRGVGGDTGKRPAHRKHWHESLGTLICLWCLDGGWNYVWPLAGIEEFENGPTIGTQRWGTRFRGRPSTDAACSCACADRAAFSSLDGRQLAVSHDP